MSALLALTACDVKLFDSMCGAEKVSQVLNDPVVALCDTELKV